VLPWSSPAWAAPDRWGASAGGKEVRAAAVQWTRLGGFKGAAACPGRARKPCPVRQQGGGASMAHPPPHLEGYLAGPSPCGESSRGVVARGAGLQKPVKGLQHAFRGS